MCGIVGILGKGPVAGQIVEALKRLEYRGYDSAGVATLENGRLTLCRALERVFPSLGRRDGFARFKDGRATCSNFSNRTIFCIQNSALTLRAAP